MIGRKLMEIPFVANLKDQAGVINHLGQVLLYNYNQQNRPITLEGGLMNESLQNFSSAVSGARGLL